MGTSFVSVVGICACCTSFVKFSSVMPDSCRGTAGNSNLSYQGAKYRVIHQIGIYIVVLIRTCKVFWLMNRYFSYRLFNYLVSRVESRFSSDGPP